MLMTTDKPVFCHISNLHDGMSQENPLVSQMALKTSERITQWIMQIAIAFNNSYLFLSSFYL
jgi:hypothetical protein